MPSSRFTVGLCLLALTLGITAARAAEAPLTLADALSRAVANNPGLHVFDFRRQAVEGRLLSVDQPPALDASLEVENMLGSGELRGADGAEYTLSLSSVLELGDKRRARVGVVDAQLNQLGAEQRAGTLDVLGQVTQRFVTTLALQYKRALAAEAVSLAEAAHASVTRRVQRGAAPEAEALRARAALVQSRIEQSRLQAEFEHMKMALAALWGDTRPTFGVLAGDLFLFGAADSFDALFQRVKDSPALQTLASEQRLRNAEVQLARSQSEGDIRWQVGVRQLGETDDPALVAGVTMPLFPSRRQRGELQAALAARDEVQFRREDQLLDLHARLFEAYRARQHGMDAVRQLRDQVLPDLTRALALTREAYESGRYGYAEWSAAQRELLTARWALVDAAASVLLQQAMIEQLTAQPLSVVPGAAALDTQD